MHLTAGMPVPQRLAPLRPKTAMASAEALTTREHARVEYVNAP